MKVQINATSFRFSDDTESTKETAGAVKFLTDHGVPFTRYTSPKCTMSGVTFPEETRVQWHESAAVVEIPCSTIEDLQKYCKEYDCTFTVDDEHIRILFE